MNKKLKVALIIVIIIVLWGISFGLDQIMGKIFNKECIELELVTCWNEEKGYYECDTCWDCIDNSGCYFVLVNKCLEYSR